MQNMAKLTTTFAMLLLCSTYIAAVASTHSGGGGGALKAACKKTAYAAFCTTLLRPHAAELKDKDAFGSAAISATLVRAEATQSFISRQEKNTELSSDQRAALDGCLDNVGYSVEALRQAAAEFEKMRAAENESKREFHKKKCTLRLTISNNDQKACYESLDGIGGEMIKKFKQQVDEAAKAGLVAKSLIQKMN